MLRGANRKTMAKVKNIVPMLEQEKKSVETEIVVDEFMHLFYGECSRYFV